MHYLEPSRAGSHGIVRWCCRYCLLGVNYLMVGVQMALFFKPPPPPPAPLPYSSPSQRDSASFEEQVLEPLHNALSSLTGFLQGPTDLSLHHYYTSTILTVRVRAFSGPPFPHVCTLGLVLTTSASAFPRPRRPLPFLSISLAVNTWTYLISLP
jgi:hypothetical protein